MQQALDVMRKFSLNKLKVREIVRIILTRKGDMQIESIIEFFKEVTGLGGRAGGHMYVNV